MASIQKWLRTYYVMWRHNLVMRKSKETLYMYRPSLVAVAFIFSELRRGSGIRRPLPPVVKDQKMPGLNRVKHFNCIMEGGGNLCIRSFTTYQNDPRNPNTER